MRFGSILALMAVCAFGVFANEEVSCTNDACEVATAEVAVAEVASCEASAEVESCCSAQN